ncbi:HAF repeat-containing PEP-CTERM protein [Nitrosomonas ureae]|nr:HAF repeat-containing PEP-CTERM protein [Nitrosomonas ureae]
MMKIFKKMLTALLLMPLAAHADWSLIELNKSRVAGGDLIEYGSIAINNSGEVLVYNNGSPFVIDSDISSITRLGTSMSATEINDSGQVAGWFNVIPDIYSPHVFITNHNGSMIDLGDFGQPISPGFGVIDINNSGQLIVNTRPFTGPYHAYLTGPNGVGITELKSSFLSEYSAAYVSVNGINDHGQIVGIDYGHPFITGPNGAGRTYLSTFDDIRDPRFIDVNNSGQVIGNNMVNVDRDYESAFVTGPDGIGITDLGTLGGRFSYSYDINDSGEVVGYSTTATGDRHSFLFSHGGMTDLSLLDIVVEAGLRDIFVLDINDNGQMVGYGINEYRQTEYFILSYTPDTIFTPQSIFIPSSLPPPPIPEPETYAMLLAGLGLIGYMVRRRNKLAI